MVTVIKAPAAPETPPVEDAKPAPVSADLQGLAAEAAALEAEAGGAAPGQPGAAVPAVDNLEAELLSALQMARLGVGKFAFGWWQDFPQVWNDQTLQAIASAGAEIMRRHGWSMGEVLSQWGPYIALAGAVAPPSLVTWQALQERKAQERRARQEGATNGGQSVTPA